MEKLKKIIVPAAIIGAVYLAFFLLGVGCPIKFATGISCPGCGITRAFMSLAVGDFAAAFYYHPLFPLAIMLIVAFILHELGRIGEKPYNITVYAICTAFIIVWIVRFFVGDGVVVAFSPEQGAIYVVLNSLFSP